MDSRLRGNDDRQGRAEYSAQSAVAGCHQPVLIRIEAQGSHGYRPLDRRIAELADIWAFVARQTGMAVKRHP